MNGQSLKKMKRASKAEWLQGAPDALAKNGIEAIRIQPLARRLGISKSGFYWHFKDRHELTRYDLQMKAWAKADPAIARRVRQVFRLRLKSSWNIFREMGFRGEDLELRTRLFIGYHSWERVTFDDESKKKLQKYIPAKIALLTEQ